MIRNARLSDLPTVPLAKGATGLIKEAALRSAATVFLSHSHFDSEHLGKVIQLLESSGASVYVDIRDHNATNMSGPQIATHLRQRICESKRLVVVGSGNLSSSRWIPWELGLADGVHGLAKIAILPVDRNATQSAAIEQEYLATYPSIRVEDSPFALGVPREWKVHDPRDGMYWSLSDWLTAPTLA